MPPFANDELDPTRAGGDVLLQICAGQRDTVVHTVRELMRAVAGTLDRPLDARRLPDAPSAGRRPQGNTRNLFAFRDGTANPDVDRRRR